MQSDLDQHWELASVVWEKTGSAKRNTTNAREEARKKIINFRAIVLTILKLGLINKK